MKAIIMLAFAALFMLPTAVRAQSTEVVDESLHWYLVEKQMIASLSSPIDNVRVQSLKNAILFATLYRDQVNLGRVVYAIQHVCDEDAPEVRKLGLAALQAIGSRGARSYLASSANVAESEEARTLIATVVNEHYQRAALINGTF